MSYEVLDDGALAGVRPGYRGLGWLVGVGAAARRFGDRMDELIEGAIKRVVVALGGETCDLVCPCDPTTTIEPDPERWDGDAFWCESCWQGRVLYITQSMLDTGARVGWHEGPDGSRQYVVRSYCRLI
jgi:hypothetical protein